MVEAMSDDFPTIDEYLAAARARLDRVEATDLDAAVATGDLLVDIRPQANRDAEGEIPGAVVMERNVLEWRLAPASPDRLAGLDPDRRVIIVCNDGYASSLAATVLLDLGRPATDLVSGYRGWSRMRTARQTGEES